MEVRKLEQPTGSPIRRIQLIHKMQANRMTSIRKEIRKYLPSAPIQLPVSRSGGS